jgi:hypothetical protein
MSALDDAQKHQNNLNYGVGDLGARPRVTPDYGRAPGQPTPDMIAGAIELRAKPSPK